LIVILIEIVHYAARLLTLVVFIDVILSYFMSPYSSIRITLDRIVGPMLAPIRRVIPSIGMVDISPIVLLILIQVIDWAVTNLLLRL
jgi:YggT family protein